MNKRNKIIVLLMVMILLVVSGAGTSVFGASQLKKEYKFYPDSENHLEYNVPKTLEKDGKTYNLIDVTYRVDDTIRISQKVTTKDKDYPKNITKTVKGEQVVLTANEDNIKWEKKVDSVKRVQEYKNRGDIPDSIDATKNDKKIKLELINIEDTSKNENFAAPAKFYAPNPNETVYKFNGKIVTIKGKTPTWAGYKEDVKSYLGLKGNTYSVTGGKWTSEFKKDGDMYIRTATYTGSKIVPVYRATFVETADTSTTYTAEIEYDRIAATAVATYETKSSLGKIIAIGAGAAILIALIIALLYLIAKRHRSEE